MNEIDDVVTPTLQPAKSTGKRILPAALLLAMASTFAGMGHAQTVAD